MKLLIKEIQHCSTPETFMPPNSGLELLSDFQKGKNRLRYVFKRQVAGDPKSSKTTETYPQVSYDSLPRIKSLFDKGSTAQSLINEASQKVRLYSGRWYVNSTFGLHLKEFV